jgi:hypothetical protein
MNEHFLFALFSLIAWLFLLAAIGCMASATVMIVWRMRKKMIFDMAVRMNAATIGWAVFFTIAYAFGHMPGWAYLSATQFVIFVAVRVWLIHADRRADWDAIDG